MKSGFIWAAAMLIAGMLALTGCSISSTGNTYNEEVHHVHVDGQTITCLYISTSGHGVYPSCDWNHPR